MPYANIVFVKIQMDLFEDPRFLVDLNDTQKGLFLMMLGLAGKTHNKIRDDVGFIKGRLNLTHLRRSDLQKIATTYPKFQCVNGFWQFDKFEEIHNYTLKANQRNSQGNPSDVPEPEEKKNQKEKKKEKKDHLALFSNHDLKTLKTKIAEKQNHAVDSEANILAVNNLIASIAKDTTVKKPMGAALFRIENS